MPPQFYRQLVERGVFAVIVVERDGRVSYANARAAALLGYDPTGQRFWQLFATDAQRSAASFFEEVGAADDAAQVFFAGTAVCGDGSLRALEVTGVNRSSDPAVAGLVFGIADVSQARAREEALERLALTDILTGLPNRALLLDRIGELQRAGRSGALAYLDLDRFKSINDRFGHSAGDQLLATLAARLSEAVPADATVARLGGDEFVLLLPEVSLEEAADITEVACASLRAPVPLPMASVSVTCCAGVAALAVGTGSDDVLRRADVAMYAAKAAGGDRVLLEGPETEGWARERRTLEDQLSQAHAERLRLLAESRTDALTGLPNRRALDEDLPLLAARSSRTGLPFAVVFVDIDNFGSYNHVHGDAHGDLMLKIVAATLAGVCRATDVAYRKGGEEFVIALADTDLAAAQAIAERARAAVEAQQHEHGGTAATPVVTVTAGVSASRPGVDAADVVELAAAAVYAAKEQGRRNSVTSVAHSAGVGGSIGSS